jgi:hypothetical protein
LTVPSLFVMITHNGLGGDINRENRREFFDSVNKPLTSMVIIALGIPVATTQKTAANTSINHVIIRCG